MCNGLTSVSTNDNRKACDEERVPVAVAAAIVVVAVTDADILQALLGQPGRVHAIVKHCSTTKKKTKGRGGGGREGDEGEEEKGKWRRDTSATRRCSATSQSRFNTCKSRELMPGIADIMMGCLSQVRYLPI